MARAQCGLTPAPVGPQKNWGRQPAPPLRTGAICQKWRDNGEESPTRPFGPPSPFSSKMERESPPLLLRFAHLCLRHPGLDRQGRLAQAGQAQPPMLCFAPFPLRGPSAGTFGGDATRRPPQRTRDRQQLPPTLSSGDAAPSGSASRRDAARPAAHFQKWRDNSKESPPLRRCR